MDEPAKLAWALHHLAAATAELDATIARRLGLSAGDYLALKHLVVAESPLGPVELSRLLGITSGAASGLVDRLEGAGFVRREPHRLDRRRQVVTATERARMCLVDELQPLTGEIDHVAAALTPDQLRAVTAALLHLADAHRRHAR